MASRLQDVILRGLAADRPLPGDVAPGTLYHSNDTQVTERCADDGASWESYSDLTVGGVPGLHAATHEDGGSDEVALAQGQVIGLTASLATKADLTDPRFTDARTPTIHGASHFAAGLDPVDVKNLGGYPGGVGIFLRGDATFAAVPDAPRFGSITMIIDGGLVVITTGLKGYLEIPFACNILAATMLADASGSIVVDIWKAVYASFPPTAINTITAAAKPTITAAIKSQDTVLAGWITSVTAGDVLAFNVDSVATIKRVTLSLKIQAV